MPTKVRTGVGRIVWGHPLNAQTKKDQNTKQPVLKDGQPVQQWAFGVAFPKSEFGPIWQAMSSEIATGYPQGAPQGFAYKYTDGDGTDRQGKSYASREGYAGCYILSVTTEAFAPSVFRFDPASGRYQQLTAQEIKCGDYVVLAVNFQVNVPTNRTHTPSLYVNPEAVEFVAFGQPIVTQANPDELFGRQQYALPPGATLQPQAPQPGFAPPGQLQAPQPGLQPGADGVYRPQPGPMPGAPQQQAYAPPQQQAYAPPQQQAYAPPQQPGQPQYAQPAPGGYAPPQGGPITSGPPQQPGQLQGYPPNVAPAGDFTRPQMPGAPYTPPQPGNAPTNAPGGYAPQPGMPATGYPSNQPQPGQPYYPPR